MGCDGEGAEAPPVVAAFGASYAANATSGLTAARAPNQPSTHTTPAPRYEAKNAVWGGLSRHLSRLDKPPQTVVTLSFGVPPRTPHPAMCEARAFQPLQLSSRK
ncbi:hypothetical protein GCM10027360_90300 [Amycolatopsis echigonensis]